MYFNKHINMETLFDGHNAKAAGCFIRDREIMMFRNVSIQVMYYQCHTVKYIHKGNVLTELG